MVTPWVSSARLIGENSANNVADTSLVAANADGSMLERLELLQTAPTGVGTRFWVKKTLTSSGILASAASDVTGVSSGGDLKINDVIVKTDSTGLAAGTNFELKTNNAKGLLNFFVTAVSGLGATKTIDLANASVTKIKTVLESGKKIQVQSTAADCTGDGTIDVWIEFERIAAGATVAAA